MDNQVDEWQWIHRESPQFFSVSDTKALTPKTIWTYTDEMRSEATNCVLCNVDHDLAASRAKKEEPDVLVEILYCHRNTEAQNLQTSFTIQAQLSSDNFNDENLEKREVKKWRCDTHHVNVLLTTAIGMQTPTETSIVIVTVLGL